MLNYEVKNKKETLILCAFLGITGSHHFYNKKYKEGILYLFTYGLFMVGWIHDIIKIIEQIKNNDTKKVDNHRNNEEKNDYMKNKYLNIKVQKKHKRNKNYTQCRICNQYINKSILYCPYCKNPQYKISCNFCGNKIYSNTIFCDNCGKKLKTNYKIHTKNMIDNIINGNFPKEYIVFDTETTGLYAKENEIIEFNLQKYVEGKLVKEFSSLVKPEKIIPEIIEVKIGITNNMVKNKENIKHYLENILNFIDNDVVIGHNIAFDLNFLYNSLLREDMLNFDLNIKYIDTLELSRIFIKETPNHKLETLKKYLNINTISHRASNDCFVTNALYQYIINKIKDEKELEELEYNNRLNNLNSNEHNFINYMKNKIYELDEELNVKISFLKDYTMKFEVNGLYLGKVKIRGKNFKIQLVNKNNTYELNNLNYEDILKYSNKWITYLKSNINK